MKRDQEEVFPLVIIGAGPVGLAAAAQAVSRGINPVILEAGNQISDNLRSAGHVRLFSPWRYNLDRSAQELLVKAGWTPPDPETLPTAGELVSDYLEPLSNLPSIQRGLKLGHRVTHITRAGADKVKTEGRQDKPFLIRTRSGNGEVDFHARAVIDASGTWNQPNPMGGHGVPAAGEEDLASRLTFGMPDIAGNAARFAGKRVMVLGSGHSAAGNLMALAALVERDPQTRVVWAVRGKEAHAIGGGSADELPARGALGTKLKTLRDEGGLELFTGFVVVEVTEKSDGLSVRSEDDRVIEGLDHILVATGSRPNLEMTRELRLQFDPWLESTPALAPLIDPNVHSCGTVPPHGHRELEQPEEGFYFAGAKSYGRAPNFLLATGYEQVRSIVAALAGDRESADRVQLVLPKTGVCSSGSSGASCCGGPAPAGQDACCALDAEAKAAGQIGCGCGTETPKAAGKFDLLGIQRL